MFIGTATSDKNYSSPSRMSDFCMNWKEMRQIREFRPEFKPGNRPT